VLRSNNRGWINEDLMMDWIDEILTNFKLDSNEELCLIMDRCTVHTSVKVMKRLRELNI
jgi:hypothetical protein